MSKVKFGKMNIEANDTKGLIFGLVILMSLFGLLALWTDRTLEFWLTQMSDQAVNVPYWLSFLLTLLLNGGILLANVVSEILRLVM